MLDRGGKGVVFVVDDEPAIAESAALILCGCGFDARAFTDPLTAWQAARVDAPDLLLSDVIMPGLNGYQLSAGVMGDCPQCKVLLFSGNPNAGESYATTAADKTLEILIKPVRPAELLSAIRSKLDA
jgi:DNA-binding NtrC family response regulator